MKVLVLGSGAREHALVWKLAQEHPPGSVICAPGNPGIAKVGRCIPVDIANLEAVRSLAASESIDLTIVGPELPLALGIVDMFAKAGLAIFGPTRAAAQLESSKAFAKEFMAARSIPTAQYQVYSDAPTAIKAAREGRFGFPVVLKADGLAGGKGVIIAPDGETAEQAVRSMLIERRFGDAGIQIVMEEYMDGEEASFFAICDGRTAWALPASQDHKRIFDNDRGPNTGGMGAFAPSPCVTPSLKNRIFGEIIEPVLNGLSEMGTPYRGLLYVGLMLTSTGPKVVEFNVRFGDPETQAVLPMITGELTPILLAAANGEMGTPKCAVSTWPHVAVVAASQGYPGSHETGFTIGGLENVEQMSDVMVFHAGTKQVGDDIKTAGGRVLSVVGRGETLDVAIAKAYEAIDQITFTGKHVRRDIGKKALSKSQTS